MKKLILILALVLTSGTMIFAQSQQDVKTLRKNTSHWSLGVKGGLDYFRVTPRATGETTLKRYISQGGWSFGLFVDYAVNPYYSIGLDGGFLTYNRGVNGGTYKGNTIDVLLMNSINMSNLLVPYRTGGWRYVDFYLTIGFGGALYTFQTPTAADFVKRGKSALGVAGIDVEFKVAKSISLLLEGQYRYYTRTNLGGVSSPTSNDALAANIGLRWKIGAGKKNHVRNMIPKEYRPVLTEESTVSKINDTLLQRVNTLENNYSKVSEENKGIKRDYNDLRNRLNDLESKRRDYNEPKTRLNESGNVKATPVELERELEKLKTQESPITLSFENIEFEFKSSNLTSEAKEILDQIIVVLKANRNWNKINIYGHTDNLGTPVINMETSEKRANAVKDYLVANGIDASKLVADGYGSAKPIATNDTPEGRAKNRRVEFRISK